MERLTKREDGMIVRACHRYSEEERMCYGCVHHSECVDETLEKLAQYEDAEESGMLMRLPCPMGSTIYMIVTKRGKVNGVFSFVKTTYLMESNVFRACREFGKTVFLTKEEAQAAMGEWQKQHGMEIDRG